jgi:hypothetical protein
MENQNLKNLKPGDKTFVRHGSSYHSYTPATVVKITPSGLVNLRIGNSTEIKQFNDDGYLRGGSRYYDYHIDCLTFAEREIELAKDARQRKASQLINAVSVEQRDRAKYGKESMQAIIIELQKQLDAAREAVEAI